MFTITIIVISKSGSVIARGCAYTKRSITITFLHHHFVLRQMAKLSSSSAKKRRRENEDIISASPDRNSSVPIASTEESHNSPKKVRWDNSVSSGDEDTGEPTETQAEPREKVSQVSCFVMCADTQTYRYAWRYHVNCASVENISIWKILEMSSFFLLSGKVGCAYYDPELRS